MIRRFKFEILPIAKGRPRFSGKGKFTRTYTPAKTKEFENMVAALARLQTRDAPAIGPLVATMVFEFKKAKTSKLIIPSPDVDNLIKSLLDALNGVAYMDDRQIWDIGASKRWGPKDCIYLELEPREPNEDGI